MPHPLARTFLAAAPLLVGGLLLAGPPAVRAVEEGGEKVYQRALKSTVWIIVPVGKGRASMGTGSLIDASKRIVLTNYHVVLDQDEAIVQFPIFEKGKPVVERDVYRKALRQQGILAKVIARDSKRDLALLRLESVPREAVALKLAADSPSPGQRVHSVGNPAASDALWVYTPGQVRQVYKKHFNTGDGKGLAFEVHAKVVETTSPINPGDSGGPLLNDRGEMVAVTQGSLVGPNTQLVNYFIDVSEVKALLAEHKIRVVAAPPPPPRTDPKGPESADDKLERSAASSLDLLREQAKDPAQRERVIGKLKAFIKRYPTTQAAKEAKALLEKLEN